MDRILNAVKWALVACTIAWFIGFIWYVQHFTKKVERARQIERENTALVQAAQERARTDVKQSEVRASAKARVASVQASNKKEESDAQEPRPSLSAGQLDRLRRLRDAANDGIRTAE